MAMGRSSIPKEKLSLVVYCYADIQRGVGTAYGLPVLKYGAKRWSARKVSDALGPDGIALDNRWIERETLEALGIGPLGRFTGGAPITPIKLKAWELLYRGGEGMGRFFPDFEFDRNRWIKSAEPEALFYSHLDFLRSYGISGGLIAGDEGESAAFLGGYLRNFLEQEKDGTILVLTPRAWGETYMKRQLPRDERIGLGFYENIAGEAKLRGEKWDILVLVKPEDLMGGSLQEELYKETRGIKTRLRLGICFDPSPVVQGRRSNNIRALFGIRGEMQKLAGYVFRDPREARPLPRRYQAHPRVRRKPPAPFGGEETETGPAAGGPVPGEKTFIAGGARFIIHHRFKSLPSPKFKDEQQWFPFDGPPAPPAVYIIRHDYELSFDRLNKKQRAFFLYWRGEFRRGNPLETYPAYILLYARELILSMGANPPMENFRELLRLWKNYRAAEPDLDYTFPQWLIDFAVLYETADQALPLLLPSAGEGRLPLLRDLYLHRRYIEEGKAPDFSDLMRMLDYERPRGASNSPQEEERYGRVFRALDRYLRETYGKNFLAFFYPPIAVPRLIRGFAALHDTGYSAYTAEWIGFYDHTPLRDFIKSICAYVDYLFRGKTGSPRTAGAPSPEPVWKEIIHKELGLFPDDTQKPEEGPLILEADRVSRLRSESDEVRDLLRIEEEYGDRAGTVIASAAIPRTEGKPRGDRAGPDPLEDFLRGLGAAEAGALELIAGQPGPDLGDRLRKLALENMTMPELLFDAINEGFREEFNDLLIDTLDGVPAIHAEYREEIQRCFRRGS
ncbi:MAG: TerB N-terminal domain-containing protein [Treponema sp.]|jgi:hypothetical protein|nr:TerB N-terminal domain-containing protein [Treponema sp.]